MEKETARRILKRPCSAQIMDPVLFQQTPHFICTFEGRLGGRQPAFDLWCQVIRCCHCIRFQTGFAKQPQHFAERKCPHVRRVSQNLPAVLISCARGMFAGVDVFHQHPAACAANTSHLPQNRQRLLKMMQRKPAHHNVEGPILKRKILRIGGLERHIEDAAFFRPLPGERQHGVRQVDTDGFSRASSKGFRDVPRPRGDIQHALVASKMGRGD